MKPDGQDSPFLQWWTLLGAVLNCGVKGYTAFLILIPVLAIVGEIRGRFGAPDVGRFPEVAARLIPIGRGTQVHTAPVGTDGAFYFPSVSAGSYVLEGKIGPTRLFLRVVRVTGDEEADAGSFLNS
jgi:hypothetical protein